MSEPRRLDPRSVLSRLLSLSAIRQQWGLVVALLAGFGFRGGFRVASAVGAVALIALVTLAITVVEWVRFSYAVDAGRLVVRRGLIRRALTVVPLDRIRGVDVHSSALQRLLGIAVLRVDAAATGGEHDEAVLDAVSAAEAARLRTLLLREAPAPSTVDAPAASSVQLARLRPVWLLYAPLVGSYLVAPVVAVAALQQYLDELHVPWFDRLADRIEEQRWGALLVVTLAVAALLVCALGAIATAAIANWGFTLSRRGGSYVSERGLLSRRQVSLEVARVRGWTLAEPASLRLVGAARLTAVVTGLGGDSTRRGQLLPLGPAGHARAVAAVVLPFDGELRRHPPAARRRRLVRAIAPGAGVAVVGAVLGQPWALGPGLVLAALGVPLGLDRYRGLGHGLTARALAVRSGSLRRSTTVLERAGVVGWQVRQTFFQRRAGLATVVAGTGAGGFDIVDLRAGDVTGVLQAVSPHQVAALVASAVPAEVDTLVT